MGSFIRIGLGIEEGESSLCGGAPRAVIPDGILKCPDPACTHPKTYHRATAVLTKFSIAVPAQIKMKPVSCTSPNDRAANKFKFHFSIFFSVSTILKAV